MCALGRGRIHCLFLGLRYGRCRKIAEGIRARLSNQRMPLAGGKFSVSIVISVQDGTSADFTRMYQDADAALYHAREDGKSGFGL